MSLENISAQLSANQLSENQESKNKLPPVELWNPPYCGEIDLLIKANGDWFYNGSIFKRLSLVQLFASVLKREINASSDNYYLVTPVEKVKIKVEDAPFLLTQWQWIDDKKQTMQVETNLGDVFILDSEHALTIADNGSLYVNVRRNLLARVHRNVYYQWVDLAEEVEIDGEAILAFTSANHRFILGRT